MRSSVSEILTEQTLGRGMCMPFGAYTGIEILDTLEVVAHERYEDLLKKAGVLNEAFIDYRTRAALRINAQGQQVVVTETVEVDAGPLLPTGNETPTIISYDPPAAKVTSVLERTSQVSETVLYMKREIGRRADAPTLSIPLLRMTKVQSSFSLADITDTDNFRKLGATLAANPDGELNRTLMSARVVVGADGIKRTELIRSEAAGRIRSNPSLFSFDQLRVELTNMVLASPAVPARKEERAALQPLLNAFFAGLGEKAEEVLSANIERAGARLIRLVGDEQHHFMLKPSYQQVVKVEAFTPTRITDKTVSPDRLGPFSKSLAYEGWTRSLFLVEWFDSSTERDVANMLDTADDMTCWVRRHIKELPILWNSGGQQYNPDFIAIESDGTHWVVEAKMDKEMSSEDVRGKREAAKRWANHVSADGAVGTTWRYLLVSESDIKTAKGSWSALKGLGS